MRARIYKERKIPTQSGKPFSEKWVLEYVAYKIIVEPVMGWTSGFDPYASEVKIYFASREAAKHYAERMKIEYDFVAPAKNTNNIRSYVQNFL